LILQETQLIKIDKSKTLWVKIKVPAKSIVTASFISETIPDNTKLTGGKNFTKTWIIKNTGNTTWNSNYRLKYVNDQNGRLSTSTSERKISGTVKPGKTYTFKIDMKAPSAKSSEKTYREDWKFIDPTGNTIKVDNSQTLWTKIIVPAKPLIKASFISETIPDNTKFTEGKTFTKNWTIKNTGNTTWSSNYRLKYVNYQNGRLSTSTSERKISGTVKPGKTYTFKIDMKAPSAKSSEKAYREDWKFVDPTGNTIKVDNSQTLWTKIIVPAKPIIKASFISETIPDNTKFTGGKTFTKTWSIKNTGNTTWNSNYRLKFVNDQNGRLTTSTSDRKISGTVKPGKTYTFKLAMKAPSAISSERTYREDWKFVDPSGNRIKIDNAQTLWVQIIVPGVPIEIPDEPETPIEIPDEPETPVDNPEEHDEPIDIPQEPNEPTDIPEEHEEPTDIPEEHEESADIPDEQEMPIEIPDEQEIHLPYQILSPVEGNIKVVSSVTHCSTDKWCFNQHQTGFHNKDAGICHADDTYAWDINLNSPTHDSDNGQPVYVVADGFVTSYYGDCTNAGGTYGQVLIEHTYQDTEWWSGYLHLKDIQVSPGEYVTSETLIGYISHTSPAAGNNHLHFAVYTGNNTYEALKSFDVQILERVQVKPVDDCSQPLYFDQGIIIPDNEIHFIDIPVTAIEMFLESYDSALKNIDLFTYDLDPSIDERNHQSWSEYIGSEWMLEALKDNKPGIEKYSAAKIIYLAAKENNVNPVILLSYLQKEQGLISRSSFSNFQHVLNRAVGYMMRESGDNKMYYGFLTQLTGLSYEIDLEMKKFQTAYTTIIDGYPIRINSSFAHFHYDYTPHLQSAVTLFNVYNSFRSYFIRNGYAFCVESQIENEVSEEQADIIFGDVDGNRRVDINDVQMVFQFFLGIQTPTSDQLASLKCSETDLDIVLIDDVKCVFKSFLGQ